MPQDQFHDIGKEGMNIFSFCAENFIAQSAATAI